MFNICVYLYIFYKRAGEIHLFHWDGLLHVSSHYQIIRPARGPQGIRLPSLNFIVMRFNDWHMHCWHNSWVSLYYLITKHGWWRRDLKKRMEKDGRDKLSNSGHQRGKYRRITMLVYVQRTLKHHTLKCTLTVWVHVMAFLYHSSSVLDKRTRTYTPTHQPRGSPISSSPSRPPLSSKGSWIKTS